MKHQATTKWCKLQSYAKKRNFMNLVAHYVLRAVTTPRVGAIVSSYSWGKRARFPVGSVELTAIIRDFRIVFFSIAKVSEVG